MKRVGITQRVEHIKSYDESRDCLDQRWSVFLLELGYIPISLPNVKPIYVATLLDALELDAIIFSGGNSIATLDSNANDIAPERDVFEAALLNEAIARNLSILGVCRGMQMLNMKMGGSLSTVKDHIAVRHTVRSLENKYIFPKTVNSYHSWGITKNDLAQELKPLVLDNNDNIEAFINEDKKMLGIMWHPEREEPFSTYDKQLIKKFL